MKISGKFILKVAGTLTIISLVVALRWVWSTASPPTRSPP